MTAANTFDEPREKTVAELATEMKELKKVLFARAPLFVKMRALIRREVEQEFAAKRKGRAP